MSFDIFLFAFRHGVKANADVVAARAVLKRYVFEHTPDTGAYSIRFDDGSEVELYSGGLDSGGEAFGGGMFAVRGLTDSIAGFIYDFARAAGCVIFPVMEAPVVLLPRGDLAEHLPTDFLNDVRAIPVGTGAELLAALNGGYDAWRAYRDHVVKASIDQMPPSAGSA